MNINLESLSRVTSGDPMTQLRFLKMLLQMVSKAKEDDADSMLCSWSYESPHFVDVSEEFAELLGYPNKQEVLNNTFIELIYPEYREEGVKIWKELSKANGLNAFNRMYMPFQNAKTGEKIDLWWGGYYDPTAGYGGGVAFTKVPKITFKV